jgi:SynChlorMet cassette radical SAM/SPASM protein ScmE
MKIMSTPRSVDISVTGRCNLRCKYCFYADEMAASHDLPTDTWLSFFDELAHLGVMDVCLTGGEALSRPDIFNLIDGVIANRMRYTILSNGTLINEQVIKQFEVGKRRSRMDQFQISIDGSRPEIHNLSRPKSFHRALHGLKLMKDAGFPVTVRVTINRHNLNDLENIAALLLDEVGLPSFSTNEAFPMGAGCQNRAQVSLNAIEMRQAMEKMARLQSKYPGRLTALAGPQAKGIIYEEMENARRTGEKSSRWVMGYLTGCGCIFNKISILHNGSIVPCHILDQSNLGNITKNSLSNIWLEHPILKSLRERRNIPMQQVPGCETCEWAAYCNGSCPGLAQQLTGDFNRANPVDCYRYFLQQTQSL